MLIYTNSKPFKEKQHDKTAEFRKNAKGQIFCPHCGCPSNLMSDTNSREFLIDETGCLIKYFGEESEVVIPNTVNRIGNFAFACCKTLFHISIPAGVTDIGIGAFSECENLITITLPDTVTSIGNAAFFACKSLETFRIPKNVTIIEDRTFHLCKKLNQRIKHIILCTNIHKLYIQSAKVLLKCQSICKNLTWVISRITTIDKRNCYIICKKIHCFVLNQTSHDNINITAYILNL